MRRAAALLAAVAMVVGAFALRSARDDGNEDGDPAHTDGDPTTLVCAADLAEVCRAAGVEVVDAPVAGETADALIGSVPLGASAWLTTSAWIDLVRSERERLGEEASVDVAGEPLASTPVAVAVWEDRAVELVARCGLPVGQLPSWRCFAERLGEDLPGGDRVRLVSPDAESAGGLVVAAAQAGGLLGLDDFASNDFESGDFRLLADRLAAGQVGAPVRLMSTRGPGEATGAGTLRADAVDVPPRFGTRILVGAADPPYRADVVLVTREGQDVPDDVRRSLSEALLAAGWDRPVPSMAPLPAGGVLAAIRTLWSQSR